MVLLTELLHLPTVLMAVNCSSATAQTTSTSLPYMARNKLASQVTVRTEKTVQMVSGVSHL